MKNLIKLFEIKPQIGWGDSSTYKSSINDIAQANDILCGGMPLIAMRMYYNEENENNPHQLSFRKWIKTLKDDDSYLGYLVRQGYKFDDGDFILDITETELDELAKVYLSYLEKEKLK